MHIDEIQEISIDKVEQDFGGSLYDELFGLVEDYDHTKYKFYTTRFGNILIARYYMRMFVVCAVCEQNAQEKATCGLDPIPTWEELVIFS